MVSFTNAAGWTNTERFTCARFPDCSKASRDAGPRKEKQMPKPTPSYRRLFVTENLSSVEDKDGGGSSAFKQQLQHVRLFVHSEKVT